MTIAVLPLLDWPTWVLRRLHDGVRWPRKLLQRLRRDPRTIWLRPLRAATPELIALADGIIARSRRKRRVVLNLMFHSVELIPQASPYASSEQDVERLIQAVETLTLHLQRNYAARSVQLAELAEALA